MKVSNKHYDVALVLGSGIKPDGTIPESAKIRTQKAIELLKEGIVHRISFSGKWTTNLNYTPPTTEAQAMAAYGESLGLKATQYLIENESSTTLGNFCNIKSLMQEQDLHSALLIINRPYHERAFLIMQTVFGPDYQLEYVLTNFRFPPAKERELEEIEARKIATFKRRLLVAKAKITDSDV